MVVAAKQRRCVGRAAWIAKNAIEGVRYHDGLLRYPLVYVWCI